jgi:DNA-binding NtrC family response regulator
MKRLHVLVVEDDDTLRELLGEVLRGWGYEAVAVDSGIRAVELLETQLFETCSWRSASTGPSSRSAPVRSASSTTC